MEEVLPCLKYPHHEYNTYPTTHHPKTSKMKLHGMVVSNSLNAAASGLNTIFNGGSYKNVVSYDILKKLQVVNTYQELLRTRNGFDEPSLQEVAREAHVSHMYVKKVLYELNSGAGIFDPQLNKRQYLKGPGARMLDSHDVACLILLLWQKPSRTLESYRHELFYATGTITSTSTICHFWKNGFQTAANL
jgi:hypothetical protein